MSETIISQLKEYASIIAEDMLVDNGGEFTDELQSSFERAMDFSKLICPACWVKDNQASTLTTSNKTDTADSYSCEKCEFEEELTRGD